MRVMYSSLFHPIPQSLSNSTPSLSLSLFRLYREYLCECLSVCLSVFSKYYCYNFKLSAIQMLALNRKIIFTPKKTSDTDLHYRLAQPRFNFSQPKIQRWLKCWHFHWFVWIYVVVFWVQRVQVQNKAPFSRHIIQGVWLVWAPFNFPICLFYSCRNHLNGILAPPYRAFQDGFGIAPTKQMVMNITTLMIFTNVMTSKNEPY